MMAAAVCIAFAVAGATAQDNFRAQLFRDAEGARLRAKEANADVLAPKSFSRAMDTYLDAKDAFQRGRPLDEIQEKIRTAARYFTASSEASKPAGIIFAGTVTARADAMSADAMRASPERWDKAEALFRSAATSLEDGDQRTARTDGAEAMGLYRAVELEAIKANFLSTAREMLARAEEMKVRTTAPQTLERAYKLANLAESMIQQNRYDNSEPRRLAEEARYEAAHAIYLHTIISQMHSQGRDLEDVILQSETTMGKISSALNLHLHFDAGMEPPVEQIIAALKNRDSIRAEDADSLRSIRAENENLRRRVGILETQAGTGVSTSADQLRKGEERKRHDQTVALASMIFTPDDGLVLRDGNTVLLRIYGLEFQPGKSTIEPRFSGLLSKIVRAVRMFPNAQITVEAHTEIGGNESLNQRISESRAEAIASYLRSTLPPSIPILSQGFGSSRGITDNITPEGRARNSRIDIIVIPEWAIVRR
jgi:OOP family OmpA-OmpF porin